MATIFVPRMSTISDSSAACTTAGWPTTRVSIYEETGLIESGVLHVSWTVTKNRFNRTCEVKSVSCPHQRFSEEFKQQVVLEVIEKPLHDQRCGKVLRSGPANRGKLGE